MDSKTIKQITISVIAGVMASLLADALRKKMQDTTINKRIS